MYLSMKISKVREMSEDTNTNEKKFHLDEFAMLLGNRMNARREEGGQVCVVIMIHSEVPACSSVNYWGPDFSGKSQDF